MYYEITERKTDMEQYEWFDVRNPPDDTRDVVVKLDDGLEFVGYYGSMEEDRWAIYHDSKNRSVFDMLEDVKNVVSWREEVHE